MQTRISQKKRETRETSISLELQLDEGQGANALLQSGYPFFDHMLDALRRHGNISLALQATGDREVDDHHTIEDIGIVLGEALLEALGSKVGIRRFGSAYAPLDESLARAVLDFSGRPYAFIDLGLQRETLGGIGTENFSHFFHSLAMSGRFTLHLEVLRGANDHHRIESAFKAFALALREAIARTNSKDVPSTKGVLV